MDFVIATNNRKKLEEIQRILAPTGHKLLSLSEVGITSEPVEDGKTFAENATQKAKAACSASGMPAIADDSGLEVDALGGAPGVLSARFAGVQGDDEANNKRLLSYLSRTPYAKRTARFTSVIALVTPDGKRLLTEGHCEGIIGFAESGENGFGYDPLFYVGGRSLADMTDEEKDAISHRAQALHKFEKELPEFLGEGPAPAPQAEEVPAEGGEPEQPPEDASGADGEAPPAEAAEEEQQ